MTDRYEMPHRRADECPHAGVGKACRPCRDRFDRAPITPDERAEWRERYTADLSLLGLADYERRVLLGLGRTAREVIPRLLDALDTAEARGRMAETNLTVAGRALGKALAEAARLRAARPAPVWDEDAVVEAVARALFRRAHPGNVAWDTLPVDEFGKEAWRESARDLLAAELPLHPATPKHLPVRPDREAVRLAQHRALMPQAMSIFAAVGGTQAAYDALLDTLADAVLALWPGESRATVQAEALRDAAAAAVAQDNNQGDWWDDEAREYGTPAEWLRARADRLAAAEEGADRG